MTPFNTLLFPDTDIFREKLYPLFLVCQPLRYLQAVEPAANQERMETDLFMESGLCQAYTPAPLGENLDRFQHLINDIRHRKDDYAAQLTSLTVAGLSSSKNEKSGEARSQIVSTLLKNHEVSADKISAREIALWQARLVLAIAEILEREEADLLQELYYLDDKELAMFQELQGETSSDGKSLVRELEEIRTNLQNPRPGEIRTRFQAWLKLMGNKPLPDIHLWIAGSRDAGDEIFNRYEKKGPGTATPVLRLSLPGKIEVSPVHLINQVEQFHRAAAEIYDSIVRDLKELCQNGIASPTPVESLLPGEDDYVEKWDSLVDEHFPSNSHSSAFLTFYLLPECSIAELLSLDSETDVDTQAKHGLMAILHT